MLKDADIEEEIGNCPGAVPSVAIRWVVYDACTNIDLAVLSNVSRSWREIVIECITDVPSIKDKIRRPLGKRIPSTFTCLLLPSLIRYLQHSSIPSTEIGGVRGDNEDNETYCISWFHPDGIRCKQLRLENPSSELRGGGQKVNEISHAKILYQWDSYTEAIDILRPFGYSQSLVYRMLKKLRGEFVDDCSESMASGDFTCASISTPNSYPCGSIYSPLGVRGATFARPEGYGQCWDNESNVDSMHPKNDSPMAQNNMTKEDREQVFLPKVLWRRINGEDTTETSETLQSCIQFLNLDSSHAVRLFTPKFEKPICTPITVFCVAVATEDGCFFSGLQQKFEMGHMYPTVRDAEINDDRSPICLNAEYRSSKSEFEKETSGERIQFENPSRVETFLGPHLDCLQSLKSDDDTRNNSTDTESYSNAVRGQLGPGAWHCYVAIFEGNRSMIRIDGVEESITHASTIPPSFQACLDGITIGSDHSFNMSLCFGEGSDGEGEGAISELAFFKGRLPIEDIKSVESHLMIKHGIPFPFESRKERIKYDFYSRMAHRLMDQSPSCKNRGNNCGDKNVPVPLRFVTELREVAWQQRNTVTGQRVSIRRIGDKFRKGSITDW